MIVNEAAWRALRAFQPESLNASIGQALERAGLPADGLDFLPQAAHANLQDRLLSSAIMAFRYKMLVKEQVRQELFGWLEEYTGCLGENLSELVRFARNPAREDAVPTLKVWKDDGF